MGLINARNLSKAKALLEKNRHKVGDYVGKATEQIDKVSKGKTNDVSRKIEDAARKYSEGATTHHGAHPDAVADPVVRNDPREPVDEAELARHRAEANIAAAHAVKAAADAASSILGRAAARGDAAGAGAPSGDDVVEVSTPSEPSAADGDPA